MVEFREISVQRIAYAPDLIHLEGRAVDGNWPVVYETDASPCRVSQGLGEQRVKGVRRWIHGSEIGHFAIISGGLRDAVLKLAVLRVDINFAFILGVEVDRGHGKRGYKNKEDNKDSDDSLRQGIPSLRSPSIVDGLHVRRIV